MARYPVLLVLLRFRRIKEWMFNGLYTLIAKARFPDLLLGGGNVIR